MCGISGTIGTVLGKEGESDAAKVSEMAALQTSRGPDSSGFWGDGICNLGHNRLSIRDLSESGNQPMETRSYVIVYNGEIYNIDELKDALQEYDIEYRGTSDTELLINLIEHKGLEYTLNIINGIFAFAVYNKETHELILVRDRLGVKPLFYYLDNSSGTFFFASTPAAIAKVAHPSWDLDYDAVLDYFVLGGPMGTASMFKGIKRLDAANYLKIKNNNIELTKYWTPQPREGDIIELIYDSIKLRSLSDVPVSLFLSGGVDSSVIAATLPDLAPVHLISPEIEYAKIVSEKVGMELQVLNPSTEDLNQYALDYVKSCGEPSMAGYIPYVTSKEVSKNFKVCISANGADELFFGYPRTPTDANTREILSQHQYDPPSGDFEGQLWHMFRHPSNFTISKAEKSYTTEGLVESIKESYILKNFPRDATCRWLELSTYIKSDLNSTLDFASMANSLEVRVPFLDYRLVERALTLSGESHITPELGRKAHLKEILRKEGIPDCIWKRPKVGFSLTSSGITGLIPHYERAVHSLMEKGILSSHCQEGMAGRDHQYIRASALSFNHWLEHWSNQININY